MTVLEASIWPDTIRSLGFPVIAPWHYIDLPYVDAANASTVFPKPVPATDNVRWAVDMANQLLLDRSAPRAQRAAALRFAIHFMGDLHQPMHCVSRYTPQLPHGDYGGNRFQVTGSQHWHNLHGKRHRRLAAAAWRNQTPNVSHMHDR